MRLAEDFVRNVMFIILALYYGSNTLSGGAYNAILEGVLRITALVYIFVFVAAAAAPSTSEEN